jgi:WD40 repeat protein/serine/threonine protein kinase
MSKRYCIICGEEISVNDPSVVFCPKHGGPNSDSEQNNQPDETVWALDQQLKQSNKAESNTNSWQPGQLILGTYEVREKLGKGGFGTVYRVHHNTWNIDLAVKRALNLSEGSKITFINEAEKWIDMGLHPHIISCYYVRNIDGFPHTFAELAEGKSLQDWIEGNDFSLYEGDENQILARILDIAIQFAWGLAYAHEQGLIHQDVKPQNALMTPEGILKVTDFGLAKAGAQSETGEKADLGKGFLVSGGAYTRAYCSPEQAAGLKLSLKTDIWSWGVSILEMFCGGVCWMAGQAAASSLESYLEREVEPGLPKMPSGLADLLGECFQNDPAQRPADMETIASRLINIYQQAIEKNYPRKEPKATELRADNLNNKALTMLDIGKPEVAEALLREALESDSMHPAATYNLSLLEWRRGDINDLVAADRLKQIISTSSIKWPTAYLLAQIEAERGAFQEAIKFLQDIETEPEALKLLNQLQTKNSKVGLIHTFERSHGYITAVKFSKDARWAITGTVNGYIDIWDISTGKSLHSWQAHKGSITAFDLTSDGLCLLSSSSDKTIKLHEIASEICLQTFEGHQKGVNDVALIQDGRMAVSGSFDQTVRIWDVNSGKCIQVLEDQMKSVETIAVSPDGSRLLSGSDDKIIRLWSMTSNECLLTLTGHQAKISDVCFSADGRFAISACGPYKFAIDNIWLWELSTGNCIRKYNVLEYWPKTISIHPNGKWFLSGGSDSMIRLWDLASKKCLHTFTRTSGSINSLTISPDGRYILSSEGLYSNNVTGASLWSLEGFNPLRASYFIAAPLSTEAASVHENRYHLLMEETELLMEKGEISDVQNKIREIRSIPGYERDKKTLQYWFDLYSKCRMGDLKTEWLENKFDLHPNEIYGCDISPDGRFALSGCWDKIIRLWSIETGNLIRTFEGHSIQVDKVKFLTNGQKFLSAGGDKTLRLWDVASGECLQIYKGHTDTVECLAISPDEKFVISGSFDSSVRVWDIVSGTCLRVLETETNFIKAVEFVPDGSKVVVGCGSSDDKKATLQYWDIARGECLHKFDDYHKSIWSLAISPDGSTVLAGDDSGQITLWDIRRGVSLFTLDGHRNEVFALAFSPNGRFFFSGGWDFLRFWDLKNEKLLRDFTMNDCSVNCISVQKDGRHLLTGGSDMYIQLWALDWELEDFQTADWDEGALPYLEAFLTLHTPLRGPIPIKADPSEADITAALTRTGKPAWTEKDFQQLMIELGYRGFGWLRPDGVRVKLQELAELR